MHSDERPPLQSREPPLTIAKMNALRLSSGKAVPQLGFGAGTTWWKRTPDAPFNEELASSVRSALEAGFRHLDLADMYNTDVEVAEAMKQSGVDRQDLFITSKLFKSLPDVEEVRACRGGG